MICGQGVAPPAATIAHYREPRSRPRPRHRAARRDGARRLRRLDAAVARLRHDAARRDPRTGDLGYAENGYPLVWRIPVTIATVAELFRRDWPTSAAVYLPNGTAAEARSAVPQPGARRDLQPRPRRGRSGRRRSRARSSTALATPGIAALSPRRSTGSAGREGARLVGPASQRPADRRRHGALAGAGRGAGDLRLPAATPWSRAGRGARGRCCCSSWRCCRGSISTTLDPVGADFVHIVTECAKLAYADREAWYGDPDFVDVPMPTLLEPGL